CEAEFNGCTNVTISGSYAAGFHAYNSSSSIIINKCEAKFNDCKKITITGDFAGGFSAYNSNPMIECEVEFNGCDEITITGSSYAGGFNGYSSSSGTIEK